MKNRNLIIYRIVTGLFTLLVVAGASQYFFNHAVVKGMFESLHYPTYLIYPMGFAKVLGVGTIWLSKSKVLKEWAYAGFVFNFLLAISAHLNVNDGEYIPAVLALVFVVASYIYNRKVNATK
ncbi:DoxX family protein [Marinilongibacter aquaticus]|uniref:DoxX family protein n=1 Tax=Marinilongibacter aquaticus TaxID=2975157 RepID=UPI0021BDC235|nr:DoxX family protein [Marinilongibacter aquaticus]UBM58606.1 DoxX family protein [Marinilongibacter aquaticus]